MPGAFPLQTTGWGLWRSVTAMLTEESRHCCAQDGLTPGGLVRPILPCTGSTRASVVRPQIPKYTFPPAPPYTAWNKAKNIGLESLSRQLIIAERQFVKQERLLICKSSSILIVSFKLKEVELIKIALK